MDRNTLNTELQTWHAHYLQGQKAWSFALHISVFGAIVCSILAGIFIQSSSEPYAKTIAVTLTAMAAVLSGVSAAGGFERKWRSNRLSRSRVDGLLLDIQDESCDIKSLADGLKAVIYQHDHDVVYQDSGANSNND
jgi:hypothetical protein